MLVMLVLAMSCQEPPPTDGGGRVRCVTCARSIWLQHLRNLAQEQVKSRRYELAFETCLTGIRGSEGGPSPVFVVGAVNMAVKLGKLGAFIDSIPERSRALEEVVALLQALRFRGKGDILGILEIVSTRGRADRLGNFWKTDDARESGVDLLLELIELGASLGPGIIEPLKTRMEEAPLTRPWAALIIAGLRTDDVRPIIDADRSGLRNRLMKIYRSEPRVRIIDFETLEEPRTMRAIEEGIRTATRRLGQTPPDFSKRMEWIPVGFTTVWTVAGISALVILIRRLRVARPCPHG